MNTTTLIIITLTACLLSALCGALTIPQLLNYAKRKKIYDIPNQRKLHKNPIPRIGGVTFVPSMLLATILAITLLNALAEQHKNLVSTWTLTFLISLTIIYATGIIDDIIGATPKFKLIAQTIAATLLTTSGLYINNLYGLFGIHAIPTVIAIPLTIILILLITNAINLIDGIDGLAASLTLIALIAFLISFAREGLWVYAVLIAGLAGTLIPYLYYNIFGKIQNNTKLFMGDTGSLTLGYILAFLFVKFAMHNPNVMPFRKESLLLSITILIVPVADVIRVVYIRLRQHKHPFTADKNHIHHKLIQAKFTQHQALIIILLFAISFVPVNIILYKVAQLPVTAILLIDIAIHIYFHHTINLRRKHIQQQTNNAQ